MLTDHAKENLEKYSDLVSEKAIVLLCGKMAKAVRMSDSTACIVRLSKAIDNPYRDDWQASDIICAIVRNGIVKTVMLTRRSQVNKSHLRTSRII